MPEDEIEIHFPSRIPEELKEVNGISDAMKTHIAKKLANGEIKIQSYTEDIVTDFDEKIELTLELLQERAKFDKHITVDEVREIMDKDDNYLSVFVSKMMKAGRERSLNIKKQKKLGKTVYKI